jgi:uncharacterized membrane protein (UPF0182 family)
MGSRVIRGNLLVIPIENSILYVSPLYLRAEAGQLPELKRVIAAYGDRVVMDETLAGWQRCSRDPPRPPRSQPPRRGRQPKPRSPAPRPLGRGRR